MDLMTGKQIINSLFGPLPYEKDNFKVDVYEEKDKIIVLVDMPGFKKEDILLSANHGYLNIKASKKEEDKNYILNERLCEVERGIYLGEFDEEGIDASLKEGILKIEVKKKKTSNNKNIEIR